MQNSIEIFNNSTFGNIRTMTIDGEPWFVGRDVAASLGFKQVVAAVRRKVSPNYKRDYVMTSNGGEQHITLINEQGIYNLVMNSRLPNALAFQDWIYKDVIPSIRKHGMYMDKTLLELSLKDPEYAMGMLKAYADATKQVKQLKCTNAALTEKIMKWDDRLVLSALIRAYGAGVFKGNMQLAWNSFYKELLYQQHICVKARRAMNSSANTMVELIKPEEWPRVIKCAVAFCEKKKIKTGEILAHYNGEVEETPIAS